MSTKQHRVALVTGALGGIGRAIAQQFAADGFAVALNDVADRDIGEAAATDPACAYFQADLTAVDAPAALVEAVRARYGRLDVLVNNAGIQRVSPVVDFDMTDWTRVLALNLTAAFAVTKAVLPLMAEAGWGRIINIASAHGLVASPYKAAYVAAKHGLVGFTKTVALEVAELGITANAICPGYVRTPLVERQIDDQAAAHRMSREEVIREVILAAQPTRRFIEPEEVASLAAYLATDAARSITGAALAIDGGWTAR
jgi:3-hydroxybutyrate dehydrogenase